MKRAFTVCLLLAIALGSNAQSARKNRVGRSTSRDTTAYEFSKQNMLTMSVFDLLFTNVSLKYEFFRKDGKMGYELPLSINAGGLPDTSDYRGAGSSQFISRRNRIFQTGIALNYYPDGQAKVSYLVGINFQAAWFYYWHYTYAPGTNPPTWGYGPNIESIDRLIGTSITGALHGGVLFNPREKLTFSMRVGLGLRRYSTIFREYTFSVAQFDACLGFKF